MSTFTLLHYEQKSCSRNQDWRTNRSQTKTSSYLAAGVGSVSVFSSEHLDIDGMEVFQSELVKHPFGSS